MTPRKVADVVHLRQDSLWSARYARLYQAIQNASGTACCNCRSSAYDRVPAGRGPREVSVRLVPGRPVVAAWFTHAYIRPPTSRSPQALKAEVDKQYANTYPLRLRGALATGTGAHGSVEASALDPQASSDATSHLL